MWRHRRHSSTTRTSLPNSRDEWIEILRDIVTSAAARPKWTREVDSKFHLDLSNIPLTDFQTISDEEPLSGANVTSGYDKT